MPAHEKACMGSVKLVQRLKDEIKRLNRSLREALDNGRESCIMELLSEDDEWVDEEEQEDDEDDEEQEPPVPPRVALANLNRSLDEVLAEYPALTARTDPLTLTCAPAPTSHPSRTASSSTAAAAPSPKRRRTSLAPLDNVAATSASASGSSSSSTTARRPVKAHVVDLEEGTDEMVQL